MRVATAVLIIGATLITDAQAQSADVFAGTDSFAEAGYTPDHIAYPADRINERFELLMADSGLETFEMALAFAREKLSEANVMIRGREAGLAWISIGLYKDYVKRAARALEEIAPDRLARYRLLFANNLLEDLHTISRGYVTMPVDIREFSLSPMVNAAFYQYELQRERMSAQERESVAARESAVRDAIEAMRQADRSRYELRDQEVQPR
jgi:hypothetical protein